MPLLLLLHTLLPPVLTSNCHIAAPPLQALALCAPCHLSLLPPRFASPPPSPPLAPPPAPPGRPLMHALLEPGIAGANGVEIDRIKCDKAEAFLRQAVLELQRRGVAPEGLVPPPIECAAIENVSPEAAICLAVCWLSCIGRGCR